MTNSSGWIPTEDSIDGILTRCPQPLMALVRGETPALVLRRRYNPAHCAALMSRFYERGLLYDPHETGDRTPHRVDIGTSFGQYRDDRKAFFAHAAETRKLFATLFEGYDDPVAIMYESLALLAPDKEIKIAREADGSLYGPAIFRVYHAGLGHGPHFDSVARRTKAFDYAISRFQYQLAAVLCFQSSGDTGDSGEAFIHNCPWTPDIQPTLANRSFSEYARNNGIERAHVELEPGDLYFFFSENIHEVPSVVGDRPRAVLAIFFAMSPEEEEIFIA
ncbi:MAG TPA: hypothetical protein EYO90_06460 [Candidatus Latescibacteria bacterium]|nr:hypothetical protein [Candidatus Latescibacterota bacterium]